MIPTVNDILSVDIVRKEYADKTYRWNITTDKIGGFCDGIDAIKQCIYKILNTERYRYVIYSWNYGVELADLCGKPSDYVCVEAERRIKDALLTDSRITGVDSFDFDTSAKRRITVFFTVHTVYGDITEKKEVNY